MKATCPTCGFVADSLAGIAKHAKGCGKKAKSGPLILVSPRVPQAASWTFPVILEGGAGGRKIPSQNLYKSHDHWVYAKEAKAWKEHLYQALFEAKLLGASFGWSRWTLTRFYDGREREFDYGNIVGGAKPIPDALKHHDVIVDDKPSCFKMEYLQVKGPGSWKLELIEGVINAHP